MQFFRIYIIGERIYGDDLMKHNKLRKTDYLVYKNIPCCNMSEKRLLTHQICFQNTTVYGLHIVQTVPSVMKE